MDEERRDATPEERRDRSAWIGKLHHEWVMSQPDNEPATPPRTTQDGESSDSGVFHFDLMDAGDDKFWTEVRRRLSAPDEGHRHDDRPDQ